MKPTQVKDFALGLAEMLDQQQGEDVLVFDVAELTPIAQYFIIVTGKNARHLKALSQHSEQYIEEQGRTLVGHEGVPESGWVLLDTGDILIHIFDHERRKLYNLEVLWGDAEELMTEGAQG